ncbi:unnamed protein product [Periconia digitata]|uniref:Uncharacterized protein n=1 Tax=Periconia digitata TaxID=1303443 RepID=A0A9W4U8P7_9PLEO|nr:unnamed protein product [Periconia digitata]
MHFDRVVRYDPEIAWTTSEDRVEQLGVRTGVDGFDFGIVVYKPDLTDVVAKQPEAATKLTISSGLCMPTNVDIRTLSMWEEQPVGGQKAVQLTKTEADTDVDEGFVCSLVQDSQVFLQIFECWLQIKKNVWPRGRRGPAVLMPAALNRNGDIVLLCMFERSNDVGIIGWLRNQCRVHIMVNPMRTRCILVVVVFIGLCFNSALS